MSDFNINMARFADTEHLLAALERYGRDHEYINLWYGPKFIGVFKRAK